jgi:putative hydrolase of the HAD superfamily
MVGVKKPNPKIFHYALKAANATIKNSLMIGDNLEADIKGALNIGMDAICFNYHKEVLSSNIIGIDQLVELKYYI